MNQPAIHTEHLRVGYRNPDVVLFDDLNLKLFHGKLVCFMGPNGIGKSTLIRTLAGLQPSLHGDVFYKGEKRSKHIDPHHVALVLTDKITAGHMTALELITLGRYPYLPWNMKLRAVDKQILEQSIAYVHVEHLLSKRLYELSDGQRQMVLIARALAQDSEVIILDEPTAHLDLNNRVEVMNLLRMICRTLNKAVLMATHELDLALQTADELWLTNQQSIRSGVPEDLVLDGSLDAVFQFKGFDLKTGRVYHEVVQSRSIQLLGSGHAFLWTKNALERNGFAVNINNADNFLRVNVVDTPSAVYWTVDDDHDHPIHSLARLLEKLR